MTFQTLASTTQKMIADNSPLILTGIGVAGVITTAVFTGKATIKACEIVNVHRYDQDPEAETFISKRDIIEKTWQLYIPPVISGIVTVGAVLLAHKVGTRRAAAMASAYVLSEKALNEYRDKVAEKYGETKARAVKDDLAQDKVNSLPVTEESIVITSGGNSLCLEPMSMRYFNSSMEELRAAENTLNQQVLRHQYQSLTDFYDLIGLDRTSMSDDFGWNADELLELKFTSTIASDGRPCLVMDYRVEPIRDYDKVH